MEPEPTLPNPNSASTEMPTQVDESLRAAVKEAGAPTPETQMVAPQARQQPQVQQQNQIAVADPGAQPVADPALSQQASIPVIADDVDVIEKEWVDKAKKIVSATKDDPHEQEKEVSRLQADYLLKRYGKKIKTVD